jgi:hypothetical protein
VPTRRTLELVVITVLAVQPVFGMVKLWSIRALAQSRKGTVLHGAAEIGSVIF